MNDRNHISDDLKVSPGDLPLETMSFCAFDVVVVIVGVVVDIIVIDVDVIIVVDAAAAAAVIVVVDFLSAAAVP